MLTNLELCNATYGEIMKNIYFDQKNFSNMGIPLQKLMELNIRVIQRSSFMKPDDLMNIKKPEDIFEKNMHMFIHNSHMALNYMKETFDILENHWLNICQHTEDSAKKAVSQASSAAKKTIKKSMSSAKSIAKKTASKVKVSAKAKPKAKPKATSKVALKAKASVKKKTKAAKPHVAAHSKPTAAKRAKLKMKPITDQPKNRLQAKEVSPTLPRVGGMTEKSNMNDFGLLNKRSNFPS